jgi:hypothetical protein
MAKSWWNRVVDTQKLTVGCIIVALPGSQSWITDDMCGYNVYMKGKEIGTVYFLDPQNKRKILSHEEICNQVKKIKEKWLATPDAKNPPQPAFWHR